MPLCQWTQSASHCGRLGQSVRIADVMCAAEHGSSGVRPFAELIRTAVTALTGTRALAELDHNEDCWLHL